MLSLTMKVPRKEVQRHKKNELEKESHPEPRGPGTGERLHRLVCGMLLGLNLHEDTSKHWTFRHPGPATACFSTVWKDPETTVSRRIGKSPLFSPTQRTMNLSSQPSSRTRPVEYRTVF